MVVPRQERALNRLPHRQLHDVTTKEKRDAVSKTAGPDVTADGGFSDPKSGASPLLVLPTEAGRKGDGRRKAGEQPSKAYPPGKRLTPAEVKRSVAHALIDATTKLPICWDAACHIGCFHSPCPHSHEPLPPLNRLDHTVAMQVLRRGGLRNGPKVNPKDVDGRIAQLRAQHVADQDEKTAEGKAKAKAKAKAKEKTKAGWLIPEEYAGPVTQLEEELGDLALGPDHSWHQSFRQASHIDQQPVGGDEPSQRLECLQQLKDQGHLAPLQGCSTYLQAHVTSCLVNARLAGEDSLQVAEVLQYAVDNGHPQLAEEASRVLDAITPDEKAGAAPLRL